MGTMKVFLENIRSMARSPTQYNRTQQERIASQEAEFEAAVAASLVEAGGSGFPVLPASGGAGAGGAQGDEAAAMAAAIGASLDMHEAAAAGSQGNGASSSSSSSSGGGGGRGKKGGAHPDPAPFAGGFDGTHGSQNLAFLSDLPLLPPAPAPAQTGRGGGGGGAAAAADAGGGGEGVRKGRGAWSGGAMFGGSLVPRQPRAPSSGRGRTVEDEALARRLQDQWLSENAADRGGGGFGGGFGGQWPGGGIGHISGKRPSAPGVRICAGCSMPIIDAVFRQGAMGESFHMGCMPGGESPLPACKVCHERLPAQDGRVHFYRHNFFHEVYCPWHHDSSPRCCSCMRLEPMPQPPGKGGEGPFAELSDGRMLCMACAQTAVVDSSEGAPAFQEVCTFFEKVLNLPVSNEMRGSPVLVVDSPTLNEQTHLDQKHGAGSEKGMPTTRGLTLSEVATVMHMAPGAMHFDAKQGRFVVGPRSQVNLGERRAVTAILVLCGLPYASFSAILAHEATHAYLKLDPSFSSRLPAQVEEGICQLVSLLWLEHLGGRGTGDEEVRQRRRQGLRHGAPPSNEELRQYFVHQIKTDTSVVYGDGFRKAKAVYDAVGLESLLDHVKRYDSFPAI